MESLDGYGLSTRGAENVAAIWPRIVNAVKEREKQYTAGSNIDMSTSENWLLRDELMQHYKQAIQDNLYSRVRNIPSGQPRKPILILYLAFIISGRPQWRLGAFGCLSTVSQLSLFSPHSGRKGACFHCARGRVRPGRFIIQHMRAGRWSSRTNPMLE